MLIVIRSRIWIVQELAVAGDALIQCGSCTTSWRYWDLVIDGYQAAVLDPPRGIHLFSWMPPFRHSQYPGQVLLHPELSNTIDWAAACALHTATRRCQDSEVDHGLASLLIRFRDFLCSDPRDKIYAIFRLSKESAHIKPDYSKSVAEVYMEAVQNSVKNPFQRLALFSMLDYEHRDTTLPSWCPSLHAPAPNGRPFYRDGFLSAQRHYTIPEFEGRTMTVSGFTINRIASIVTSDTSSPDPVTSSSPCEALHNPSSPLLDPLKTLCISLGDISWIKDQQFRLATPSSELSDALSARSDYFSQRSDSSQPWYSPEVLDSNAAWEYTSREDRIYAENWVQIILKDGKTGRYYDQVIPKANLKEICKAASRRIVLCIDGSYAHVPLSAEIGDQLVVFLGGKVPFCIRKVNEGLEYHLIGDW